MRRRDFINAIAVSAAGWTLAAHAQQSERMRRIGVLAPANREGPIRQGLRELGYVEGRNTLIEYPRC